MPAADILEKWLTSRVNSDALGWLRERRAAVQQGDRKQLYLTFGLVSRKTGKADLKPTDEELAAADLARKGWDPAGWTVDQVARIWLLLAFPSNDAAELVKVADQLFATGEVHELVALYQGLSLYPHQDAWRLRCAEGIRSNIRAVLIAIAHRNPYPSEQLDEDAWNQLILKCLFVGLTIEPVMGIDRRANASLARIVTDYAEERRSAHRPISPELWRLVAPLADERGLQLLKSILENGNENDRLGVALAIAQVGSPEAKSVLANAAGGAAIRERLASEKVTWKTIAQLPWN